LPPRGRVLERGGIEPVELLMGNAFKGDIFAFVISRELRGLINGAEVRAGVVAPDGGPSLVFEIAVLNVLIKLEIDTVGLIFEKAEGEFGAGEVELLRSGTEGGTPLTGGSREKGEGPATPPGSLERGVLVGRRLSKLVID